MQPVKGDWIQREGSGGVGGRTGDPGGWRGATLADDTRPVADPDVGEVPRFRILGRGRGGNCVGPAVGGRC